MYEFEFELTRKDCDYFVQEVVNNKVGYWIGFVLILLATLIFAFDFFTGGNAGHYLLG